MKKTSDHQTIRSSDQTGFSLVEILLVITIVGFIALLVSNLPYSIRLNSASNHQSIAKLIVAKQVEDLRAKTYANLANGTSAISDSRLSTLPQASGSIIISDCPIAICANGEHLKQVSVTVSWHENTYTQSAQLDTFIGEGGLQ